MSQILAIDAGTTGITVTLYDDKARVLEQAKREFAQIYPKPGWVEHDATEIWKVTEELVRATGGNPQAIGITNQRETTVIWERATGKPIHNAIVWQCRRTASECEKLRKKGLEKLFRRKTGLVLDAYFSGTKVAWLLDNVPGARAAAKAGKLAFGTIDTWLIWKLTNGRVHATDPTNASRTLLYNINKHQWDKELCKELRVPMSLLPEVRPSASNFGGGVYGVVGDQQGALFGQGCFGNKSTKNTYGTGCFLVSNTGKKRITSKKGLLTTIACGPKGEATYALEGSVFIAGAVVQWLRDSLGVIASSSEVEALAGKAASSQGVYFVPAFVGLGAPYWDMNARGAIVGLTRGSGKAEIARAALESMAYQTRDVVESMEADTGKKIRELRVDGGAVVNDFLMQFQADILGRKVIRPRNIETTSLGAALLAGIGLGSWSASDIKSLVDVERVFEPKMDRKTRESLYAGWKDAVARVR